MASSFELVVQKDKLSGLPTALRAALAQIVEETAVAVEGRAKEAAPVDTGFLRNSISHETDGLTGVVSVGADYASNIEFGTVRRAAHPFITPSVEAERAEFSKRIATAINQAAK